MLLLLLLLLAITSTTISTLITMTNRHLMVNFNSVDMPAVRRKPADDEELDSVGALRAYVGLSFHIRCRGGLCADVYVGGARCPHGRSWRSCSGGTSSA
jgi:hypothetical protein